MRQAPPSRSRIRIRSMSTRCGCSCRHLRAAATYSEVPSIRNMGISEPRALESAGFPGIVVRPHHLRLQNRLSASPTCGFALRIPTSSARHLQPSRRRTASRRFRRSHTSCRLPSAVRSASSRPHQRGTAFRQSAPSRSWYSCRQHGGTTSGHPHGTMMQQT